MTTYNYPPLYDDRRELFADIIYEELAARGTNVEAFSKEIGISANELTDILVGNTDPDEQILMRMDTAHGLSEGFYTRLFQSCK